MGNKIAFLFAHRATDIWSTPISIVNEFRRIGYETSIYSLFDKHDNYVDSGMSLLLEENRTGKFCPDIVMNMDWGRFDSTLISKNSIPNAFWVMESGDDPQNFEKNYLKADKFDLILTPAHDSYLKYKNKGYNVLWWNHFADTNIHKQYLSFDKFPPVRSTRGQGGSQFMDLLSQIMPNKFINKNGFIGTEYGQFLSSGEIVLQNSRWKEITRRIFEGMACGKLVITDRLPKETKIDELFTENVDIVYYDTMSDCISKINYYLWNHKARKEIAERGHRKVIENHTQKQRVDLIIQEYEKWKQNFR